jgi:hypothetical protein
MAARPLLLLARLRELRLIRRFSGSHLLGRLVERGLLLLVGFRLFRGLLGSLLLGFGLAASLFGVTLACSRA